MPSLSVYWHYLRGIDSPPICSQGTNTIQANPSISLQFLTLFGTSGSEICTMSGPPPSLSSTVSTTSLSLLPSFSWVDLYHRKAAGKNVNKLHKLSITKLLPFVFKCTSSIITCHFLSTMSKLNTIVLYIQTQDTKQDSQM